MSVIGALWLREVKRYIRSRTQIVGSLGQPLMYLLTLGFGMGPMFEDSGRGSYIQFMAPGIVCMGLLFTALFSGVGVLWDRQFGFLKETLVAPVPRLQIMIGRTLGGATIAVIQGTFVVLVCIAVGFRINDAGAIPAAIMFMVLIAVVFAALGTAIGSSLRDMQGFQFIINFVVMPIFFLSGALYPLDDLPVPLVIATRLNPLSYGVDGLRGALINHAEFQVVTDAGILMTIALVFLALGARAFARIQI